MSEARQTQPARMSLSEFLEWDDGTDTRYELIDGLAAAMAPGSVPHGALSARISSLLTGRLRDGCLPVGEAGLLDPDHQDRYFVADIAITCRPLKRTQWLETPLVVIEILSPSTRSHDLVLKLECYRRLPLVTDLLFIESETIAVDHWRRVGDVWEVRRIGGERGVVQLDSLDIALPLAEIYHGIPIVETEA